MPLLIPDIDHPHAEELRRISEILDSIPTISDMVWQDLTGNVENHAGACGMSAEQVLRAVIVKSLRGFTYEELAFHLMDSRCYRHFCRIGVAHEGFAKSTLHGAIKVLSAETWEAINRLLMAYGEDKTIEKGREVRIDCTVVDSPIHHPTDSSLLWNAVRSITRILAQLKAQTHGAHITFKDHTRRAKRRMLGIYNGRSKAVRKKLYRDLLYVAECVLGYARKRLRRFRAGVESAISWLKRCFGLGRCTWKSLESFHSYVWSSIVTANLLALARSAPR
jgi:IS5 family transposase